PGSVGRSSSTPPARAWRRPSSSNCCGPPAARRCRASCSTGRWPHPISISAPTWAKSSSGRSHERRMAIGVAHPMAQPMSITEIDAAVAHVAPERRVHMLGQVTDLFVLHASTFSDDEIAVFDDVLGRLVADIETEARIILAQRLAVVPNAPHNVIRTL